MFHVEMRAGLHVMREFNLSERELWVQFLAPLMAGREFTFEGHDFIPRKTRIKVYEGPELRPDQLGMGRGWQNVERTASDVTERVLEHARAFAADAAEPVVDPLRERVIGRLSAGNVSLDEIEAMAADLLPGSGKSERHAATQRVALALLESGAAQLAPRLAPGGAPSGVPSGR